MQTDEPLSGHHETDAVSFKNCNKQIQKLQCANSEIAVCNFKNCNKQFRNHCYKVGNNALFLPLRHSIAPIGGLVFPPKGG